MGILKPMYLTDEIMKVTTKGTQRSILNSKIYNREQTYFCTRANAVENIIVDDIDSVSAVFKYSGNEYGKVAILNYASFVSPGGGCLKGSRAQEECLCYESNLYYILSHFKRYYAWNIANINNHLYHDRAIYSPNVSFARVMADGSIKKSHCDVITCAAPNKKKAMDLVVKEHVDDVCNAIMMARIQFVLSVADQEKVDTLILGAFGCGVFENDPEMVAHEFDKWIHSEFYGFKNVIFAVPKSAKNNNFEVFNEVFGTPEE